MAGARSRAPQRNWGSFLTLLLCCGCGARELAGHSPPVAPVAIPASNAWSHILYAVRAGGPHSFVGLTNLPVSNRASIALDRSTGDHIVFRLTNGEPHAILLWNVRVQIPAVGPGTDNLGWETVADDYPEGTAQYSAAHEPRKAAGEFHVQHPGEIPWRVCILYSIDWADSGKSFSGNYEVISTEVTE